VREAAADLARSSLQKKEVGPDPSAPAAITRGFDAPAVITQGRWLALQLDVACMKYGVADRSRDPIGSHNNCTPRIEPGAIELSYSFRRLSPDDSGTDHDSITENVCGIWDDVDVPPWITELHVDLLVFYSDDRLTKRERARTTAVDMQRDNCISRGDFTWVLSPIPNERPHYDTLPISIRSTVSEPRVPRRRVVRH